MSLKISEIYFVILIESVNNFQDLIFKISSFEIFPGLDFQERNSLIVNHQRDTLRIFDKIFEYFKEKPRHLFSSRLFDERGNKREKKRLIFNNF